MTKLFDYEDARVSMKLHGKYDDETTVSLEDFYQAFKTRLLTEQSERLDSFAERIKSRNAGAEK